MNTYHEIIKKAIADASHGQIKKSYIRSLRPWLGYFTFEYKGKKYKYLENDKTIVEIS